MLLRKQKNANVDGMYKLTKKHTMWKAKNL